jgi:ComF family protein
MCQICGRPFEFAPQAQTMQSLCRLCRSNFYAFDRARSYALYNETLAGAIMLLKYEEVTRLGRWFAERLADLLHKAGKDFEADAIVPVPLHPDRRRERGYNQAELIAKPLARRLGLKLGAYLLMRTKPRPPQLVLSRSEHWKSVRGAYATREGVRVDKLRILLVDDVLTTGATLDACARALKKAGAASVLGLTVAGRSGLVAHDASAAAHEVAKGVKPGERGEHRSTGKILERRKGGANGKPAQRCPTTKTQPGSG